MMRNLTTCDAGLKVALALYGPSCVIETEWARATIISIPVEDLEAFHELVREERKRR